MSAFWGLVKKDLSLIKFWYFIWLICLLLGMVASFLLAEGLNEGSILVPIYIMAVGVQTFIMPVFMLGALIIEGKTQMWLYNPQSSKKLILAKCTATLSLQLISQLITLGYGIVIAKYLLEQNVITAAEISLPIKMILFMHVTVIGTAIFGSLWILFYWTIYHSLGKNPKIKSFRWLIIIGIWLGLNIIDALILNFLDQKKLLTVSVEYNPVPTMDYNQDFNRWEIIPNDEVWSLPIFSICFYGIITVALFFISSRLLDRRVEV